MFRRGTRWVALWLIWTICWGCGSEQYADRRDEVVDVRGEYGVSEVDGLEVDSWCSDFGRSDLERVVRETWEENLALKAAWARLEQAKARAAQARSHLWPELRAEAGVTASNEVGRLSEGAEGASGGDGVGTWWNAELAASYEVDLWGKYRHRARAAKLEVRATRSDARTLAMTLTSRVAEAWFDVVEARQRLDLIERQVELSKEFLELTKIRFRQGLAAELDLTQLRQNLEALRGQKVDARLELQRSRHRLAVLTGTKPGELPAIESKELPELPPLPDPGVPADLLKRRPDVRAALYRLRAADQRTAAAVADQLPTLQLSASLFLEARQIGDLLDQVFWSLSAVAGQTLYDGGRLDAAQREAESAAEERLYLFGQTLLAALEDVRNALVGEKLQKERLESLRKERASAEASLQAARSQYREGNLDYLRVLDALQRLQELEREMLETERQRLTFRISLCRALGGSWVEDLESSSDIEE